ncbi:sugar ABC transporter permease [Caldicoprobacter algeriensis]|nr:sugar ABC transporter permease [Caldicoprobacter algeriensis]
MFGQRRREKRVSLKQAEARLGFLLMLPAILLIFSIIVYPIMYNIYLSFHKVSLSPMKPHKFVGASNYLKLFSDESFLRSLLTTFMYVIITVVFSTIVGLLVALLMNREFRGRKFARSLIILPYVAPVISTVFVWQYMFNRIYGVVNYLTVDILYLFKDAPMWFDHPLFSLMLVVLFDTWRVFPYSFMMILAGLQSIDNSLYEAAEVDGARAWSKFWHITLPEILPIIRSLVILRSIWNFYKFEDIYLLTKQVPVIGVYLYETAFSVNNHGLAAAITVVLFCIIMTFVLFVGRKVFKRA